MIVDFLDIWTLVNLYRNNSGDNSERIIVLSTFFSESSVTVFNWLSKIDVGEKTGSSFEEYGLSIPGGISIVSFSLSSEIKMFGNGTVCVFVLYAQPERNKKRAVKTKNRKVVILEIN